MKHHRFFVLAGLLFLAIACYRVATVPTPLGRQLGELDVQGWLNGEPDTDDWKGDVVVIDAWASW